MKQGSDGLRDASALRVGWLVAGESGPDARANGFAAICAITTSFGKYTFHLIDGRNVGPCEARDLVVSALPIEAAP